LETRKGSEDNGGLGGLGVKNCIPQVCLNTTIPQFEIKITKILLEKLSNTTNPNVPLMFEGLCQPCNHTTTRKC